MVPHLTWFVVFPSRWRKYDIAPRRKKEWIEKGAPKDALEKAGLFDGFEDFQAAHEFPQRLRNDDGAIGLLVLFQKRREDTGSREAGTVERVAVFGFAIRVLVTNHAATGLVIPRVGDGRDFLVDLHRRDPNLDVVSPGHGVAAVPGRELVDLVGEAKPLEEVLRLLDHFVEGGIASLLGRVLDHLDFVELVPADHAAFLGAVRTGFLAIAGGIGEVFLGKLVQGKDFVPVKVHKSGFSGREDEFARLHALEPEDIILEFRELPGGVAGFVIEDVGREDHLVTVREVVLDEIIEKGPFEAGAEVRVNPSSRARDLRSPLVINEAKGFGEGDVVFRGEIEVLLFPKVIEGNVVFLAAGEKVIVREVREDFDESADFRFDVLEFFLVFLVFRPEGFDFAEDRLVCTAFRCSSIAWKPGRSKFPPEKPSSTNSSTRMMPCLSQYSRTIVRWLVMLADSPYFRSSSERR